MHGVGYRRERLEVALLAKFRVQFGGNYFAGTCLYASGR